MRELMEGSGHMQGRSKKPELSIPGQPELSIPGQPDLFIPDQDEEMAWDKKDNIALIATPKVPHEVENNLVKPWAAQDGLSSPEGLRTPGGSIRRRFGSVATEIGTDMYMAPERRKSVDSDISLAEEDDEKEASGSETEDETWGKNAEVDIGRRRKRPHRYTRAGYYFAERHAVLLMDAKEAFSNITRTKPNEAHSDKSVEAVINIFRQILHLQQDMDKVIDKYAKAIVDENFYEWTGAGFPSNAKRRKELQAELGGKLGGHQFVRDGLLFELANDPVVKRRYLHGGNKPNVDMAGKAARVEQRGANAFISELLFMQKDDIQVIWPTIFDYRGLRFIVTALLPLALPNIVYGSDDKGKHIHNKDEYLYDSLRTVTEKYSIAEHNCHGITLCTGGDVEGHCIVSRSRIKYAFGGRAGEQKKRYYLINLLRWAPPESARTSTHLSKSDNNQYHRMFRPEFLSSASRWKAFHSQNGPLSSNTFSIWGAAQRKRHTKRLHKATKYLCTRVVNQVVGRLLKQTQESCEHDRHLDADHIIDVFAKRFPDSCDIALEMHASGLPLRHLALVWQAYAMQSIKLASSNFVSRGLATSKSLVDPLSACLGLPPNILGSGTILRYIHTNIHAEWLYLAEGLSISQEATWVFQEANDSTSDNPIEVRPLESNRGTCCSFDALLVVLCTPLFLGRALIASISPVSGSNPFSKMCSFVLRYAAIVGIMLLLILGSIFIWTCEAFGLLFQFWFSPSDKSRWIIRRDLASTLRESLSIQRQHGAEHIGTESMQPNADEKNCKHALMLSRIEAEMVLRILKKVMRKRVLRKNRVERIPFQLSKFFKSMLMENVREEKHVKKKESWSEKKKTTNFWTQKKSSIAWKLVDSFGFTKYLNTVEKKNRLDKEYPEAMVESIRAERKLAFLFAFYMMKKANQPGGELEIPEEVMSQLRDKRFSHALMTGTLRLRGKDAQNEPDKLLHQQKGGEATMGEADAKGKRYTQHRDTFDLGDFNEWFLQNLSVSQQFRFFNPPIFTWETCLPPMPTIGAKRKCDKNFLQEHLFVNCCLLKVFRFDMKYEGGRSVFLSDRYTKLQPIWDSWRPFRTESSRCLLDVSPKHVLRKHIALLDSHVFGPLGLVLANKVYVKLLRWSKGQTVEVQAADLNGASARTKLKYMNIIHYARIVSTLDKLRNYFAECPPNSSGNRVLEGEEDIRNFSELLEMLKGDLIRCPLVFEKDSSKLDAKINNGDKILDIRGGDQIIDIRDTNLEHSDASATKHGVPGSKTFQIFLDIHQRLRQFCLAHTKLNSINESMTNNFEYSKEVNALKNSATSILESNVNHSVSLSRIGILKLALKRLLEQLVARFK